MADSGGILKWGLIAGGAYLLYRSYSSSAAAAPAPSSSTAPFSFQDLVNAVKGSIAPTTGAPPTAAAPAAAVLVPGSAAAAGVPDSIATQKSKLLTAAGGVTNLTASQWNYYWGQVYNAPQTQTFLGDDGSPMTVDAYMALRQAKGFSGLGAVQVPVPFVMGKTADGRPFAFGIAPRRPGPKNYVRAGSPMRPALRPDIQRPVFVVRAQ